MTRTDLVLDACIRAVQGGFRALVHRGPLDPEEAQLFLIEFRAVVAGMRAGLKGFIHAYGPLFNHLVQQLGREDPRDVVLTYWRNQLRAVARLLESELKVKVLSSPDMETWRKKKC